MHNSPCSTASELARDNDKRESGNTLESPQPRITAPRLAWKGNNMTRPSKSPVKTRRKREKTTMPHPHDNVQMTPEQQAFASFLAAQLREEVDKKIELSQNAMMQRLEQKFAPLLTALAAGGKQEFKLSLGDGKAPIHVRMNPSAEQMKETRIMFGIMAGGAGGALMAGNAALAAPVICGIALIGAVAVGFAVWFGYVWESWAEWWEDTATAARERRAKKPDIDINAA